MRSLIWAFLISSLAVAGPSSNRYITGQFIKNNTTTLTIPSSGNDTLVARTTTDTLTGKSMDGGSNTFTNLPLSTAVTGILSTPHGGTGLASGTSGGVPYFSTTTTIASSGLLTANQLMVGGGAGAAPSVIAAGSQYQVMRMGASNPAYGSIDLSQSAAVGSSVLPIANGGHNNGSLAVTAGGVLYTDGSKFVNVGAGTTGQLLQSNGSSAPAWTTATPSNSATSYPAVYQSFNPVVTSTYSGTYFPTYIFLIATGSATKAATYTNNTFTCTVRTTVASGSTLYAICTGAPTASGTLTKATGTGDATITFTSWLSPKFIKGLIIGAGGGGGGATNTTSAGGGGGGAGATCMFTFPAPASTGYAWAVGAGQAGGTTGGTSGTAGQSSTFTIGATVYTSGGGSGGSGSSGDPQDPGDGGVPNNCNGTDYGDLGVNGGSGHVSGSESGNGVGGNGGASFFGSGGYGGQLGNITPTAGNTPGSGGGGGGARSGAQAGAAGADGLIRIEEVF